MEPIAVLGCTLEQIKTIRTAHINHATTDEDGLLLELPYEWCAVRLSGSLNDMFVILKQMNDGPPVLYAPKSSPIDADSLINETLYVLNLEPFTGEKKYRRTAETGQEKLIVDLNNADVRFVSAEDDTWPQSHAEEPRIYETGYAPGSANGRQFTWTAPDP